MKNLTEMQITVGARKNIRPVLIGKQAISSLLALALLLSITVIAIVSGTEKAAAVSETHTVESSTQRIPLKSLTFPLQLGDFKQEEQLTAEKIALDQKTGKPVITWTYTAKLSMAKTVPAKIERYFTTSLESGLGEPKITAVTKNNSSLPPASTGTLPPQ
ncbi:hypothetical protein RQN30_11355 [Arcanobacterium hippocoleae]